jgi:hypothetical protein
VPDEAYAAIPECRAYPKDGYPWSSAGPRD